MDWRDSLKDFINQNPDLPAGDDLPSAQPAEPERKLPKLQVVLERKGRAGKTATIVCGFPATFSDEEIASLAARLKQRLGTGGSARGGEILIQGDKRSAVVDLLRAEGYTC